MRVSPEVINQDELINENDEFNKAFMNLFCIILIIVSFVISVLSAIDSEWMNVVIYSGAMIIFIIISCIIKKMED